MAEGKQPSLQDLEKLSQDIISRFESALNVSTTSELTSMVDDINKSLETQANLIQNIKVNSTDRLKHVTDESTKVKETTGEIQKQVKLYGDILAHNDDISENWDKMIKQSATLGKNYGDINKKQKQYLTSLNAATKQEKKLSDLTFKRMQAVLANAKKTAKAGKAKNRGPIPQFVNVQGMASSQLALESLTGGKPYFASHPEMGVPMGLFNTKDEPTRGARIRAIEKYGSGGSIGGVFPQFADDIPSTIYERADPDELSSVLFMLGKIAIKKASPVLKDIIELIDMVNKFGDKLEEYASVADESIKSAVQAAGSIMTPRWEMMFQGDTPLTKAAYFQQGIQDAIKELNLDEGVFANIEMLTNLQKAFTEYSQTNVLLGKKDLKNLLYLQQTFDLAANDVAEIQGAFMDLGASSQDMMDYSTNLARDAKDYGVSASKLLKDTAKLMKMGAAYRFKGGVKDMEKMQVYAANAHFDIEKAYNIMDTSMSVEGAVDLAAQLQVLGGAFSDISGLELMTKAQSGDMQGVADMIVGRFRQDASKFGTVDESGMFKFNKQGNLLLNAFNNIEGLHGLDIGKIVTKAAKEEDIRRSLLGGVNATEFMKRSAEEQNTIVQNIAQGSVKELNLTATDLKTQMIDFNGAVLDKYNDNLDIGPVTAKGAQSAKDEADLNKQIVAIQSQTRQAFDDVRTGLESLRPTLLSAGQTIMDLGLTAWESPFARAVEVLQSYLGLSAEESVLFHKWFTNADLAQNNFAGAMKGFINGVEVLLGALSPSSSASSAPVRTPPATTLGDIKYGGVLEAAGGMVMGNSHFGGGVRGTGRFNNIEVEGGEAIINKRSTQTFLPLLSKLNELGGGRAFVSGGGVMDFKDIADNKTLNIKLQGKFDYVTNLSNSSTDLYDLAMELQDITSGKGYGDAR